MMNDGRLALYLHIPFCRHRCSYCDFNTYTSLGDLKVSYTDALCREIEQVGRLAGGERPCHTIFFGGGTPSLMSPAMLGQILQSVRRHFALTDDVEITMEANPGTVDGAYLTAVRQLGINRISFGVQSAIASELVLLEREHDFPAVIAAMADVRAAGFNNFSLDLIYGVPGQTLESWEESLRAALTLEPPHISLYCLTIEPGTPMNRWLGNGRIQPPDPDLAADQYELASQILADHGLIQYEISNWARPGHECRHNLVYWRNQEYLGLGAGAHGSANGYRYEVVKQPRVYIRRMANEAVGPFPLSAAVAAHHAVDRAEAMSDTIITQLRLLQEGLDLAAFQTRFGQSLDDAFDGTMSQLVDWGLLAVGNGRLRLTQQGRFLSNQVFYRFM
ncbi:MAG: radical SAM family heme chaperone HemW [Ardenticatenaceae bacterium]|nr:radical SAM family heme chaperone HemW [Ardenticatenaceae bacterium]MCB9443992.1 radical SAM family heme chaperone HemW [Ardenticatenaceae bacterium]